MRTFQRGTFLAFKRRNENRGVRRENGNVPRGTFLAFKGTFVGQIRKCLRIWLLLGRLVRTKTQVLAYLVPSGSPCTNKNASACVFGCFRSPCAGKNASAYVFGSFRSRCTGKYASACVFAPPSSRLEATKSESTFRFAHPSRRLEGTKNESTFVFAQPSPD